MKKLLCVAALLFLVAGCVTTQTEIKHEYKYHDAGLLLFALPSTEDPGKLDVKAEKDIHILLRDDGAVMWGKKGEADASK